jgi:hypothetical protein
LLTRSPNGILVLAKGAMELLIVNAETRRSEDRRRSERFPIEREVRYKMLGKKSSGELGAGQTINISSSGVLFKGETFLLPGKRVELSISWPAQLNNKTNLKLVARGRVVRCEEGCAAIEIQQYEFRTAGLSMPNQQEAGVKQPRNDKLQPWRLVDGQAQRGSVDVPMGGRPG